MTIEEALQIALSHHQAGRMPQAEAIYRQVLAQQPNHPEALHLLGVVALQVNQLNPAAELIQRAISGNPTDARYHGNFGRVLSAARRFEEAALAYRVSLSLDNTPTDIWYNLGNALHLAGRDEEAITAFREALNRKPNYADAWNNLGTSLEQCGKTDEAIAAFRKAIEFQPDLAEAHNNLGNALREQNQLEEAVACCRRAIELLPNYPEAHNNLGSALLQQLKIDQAIESFEKSLSLKPDLAYAHLNLGLALLLKGDLPHGFLHYEWRWKIGVLADYLKDVKQPMWGGGDLNGQRLLLHAEQGFGDAIHFIRYIPQVAGKGGKIILVAPPPLMRLLQGFEGIDTLVPHGESLPEFDLHCPLLSLPHIMGTTIDTIPAEIPYLKANPELSALWRNRLPQSGRMIGLAWAGRASNMNDRNRSIGLDALAPLLAVEGNSWISLQKGHGSEQVGSSSLPLIDMTSDIEDFVDTAALIDNLDLVITVDTAVAHLAGAMGKAVWMLIPHFPDWRWMLDREDSPWYPNMRLFRQPAPGDWDTPIQRIVQELRCLK